MQKYENLVFDLEEDTQKQLVDLFDLKFKEDGGLVPISLLKSLPEDEYRNMKIRAMALSVLQDLFDGGE